MSTQMKTKMENHNITIFWGGDSRGRCVQVTTLGTGYLETTEERDQQPGFIQLSMREAAYLATSLAEFVNDEARRRRKLLASQISKMKDMEKTVFREISELPDSVFNHCEIVVDLVDQFCPMFSGDIEHDLDPSTSNQSQGAK